ncbi:hypothetical protein XM38_019060 [Halomicronema hongdechloris C2206]|uniref:Uncharacterized protein n=1 Tax=Halomicronema hongdechloris C2206 TaxID=1641165 RepID=A0A1Z3HLI4_9CYAN|nr:hypothetical protein [Halomicronema hongdechloris]ASC70957.1 hypothetical protein XM38_019060 [Halomicronema hongdechloris C2206]
MSSVHHVLIDFSEAGLGYDRDQLEEFLLTIADELQAGELASEAHLARETDMPDAAKPGATAFLMGILTAEINRENLRKVVDFFGSQFYGKTLTLSGDIDGMTYSIEYRNKQELDQAAETIERLANLRLKILDRQATSDQASSH